MIGFANPAFKDGSRSKCFPTAFRDLYNQAVNDEELATLRDEQAILHARITELCSRLNTGETRELWTELRESWETLETKRAAGDIVAMQAAMARLQQLIATGSSTEETWTAIADAIERKAKIVDAEQRRLVATHLMMSADQVMAFMSRLGDAVHRHVTEKLADQPKLARDILQAVMLDFNAAANFRQKTKLIESDAVKDDCEIENGPEKQA